MSQGKPRAASKKTHPSPSLRIVKKQLEGYAQQMAAWEFYETEVAYHVLQESCLTSSMESHRLSCSF